MSKDIENREETVMNKDTEKGTSRRKFLTNGLGAAVMLGCFTRAELREALAQAKLAGKQVLTENNINKHIAFSATSSLKSRNLQAFAAQVQEFKRNPTAYVTKHFQLTPRQSAEIRETFDDANTIDTLNAFLDRAVREKRPLKVVIQRRAAQESSERRSEDASPLLSRVRNASFSSRRPVPPVTFTGSVHGSYGSGGPSYGATLTASTSKTIFG